MRTVLWLVMVGICGNGVDAATHIWASFDGDFNAATSWNTNKSPSEWLPTDNVLFNGNIDTSVTSGLDQTGVRVASILVHDEYSGDIGSGGTPLVIAADTMTFRGDGWLSFKNLPTPDKLDFAFIESDATSILLWGQHDYLIIKHGFGVVIQPSATVQTCILGQSPSNSFFTPVVKIEAGQSIPVILAEGGFLDNYRGIATGHALRIGFGDVLQIGVMETGSKLEMHGGRFTYDPYNEPALPGPIADIQEGTADFTQTFYDTHFSFGVVNYFAEVLSNHPLQLMGLIDLASDNPSVSFIDRMDTDGDGICNVFDHCIGDTDGDCRIDLKDFANMQNGMSGP